MRAKACGEVLRVLYKWSSVEKLCSWRPYISVRMASATAKTPFNLIKGMPRITQLQRASDILQQSTNALVSKQFTEESCGLQYGPNLGGKNFRSQLANFLSHEYDDDVQSDSVMQNAGASNGLLLTCSVLMQPDSPVFIEDPTYFIAIDCLKDDLQRNVVPVPTDQNGLDVDVLEHLLVKHAQMSTTEVTPKKPFKAMLYTVPTYNNPKGICMSEERSKKLIEVAQKHDLLVFCDDVYNILHYNAQTKAPPRLLAYEKRIGFANGGHVISCGTFAKLFSPGLRLGWIEAGPRIISLFDKSPIMLTGGAVNHYSGEVMACALNGGMVQELIRDIRQQYAEALNVVSDTLKGFLPSAVTYTIPQGGYFVWLVLPKNVEAKKIAEIAESEENLKILSGERCSPSGSFRNCIRVSFAFLPEEDLSAALTRLCHVIKKQLVSQ